MARRVHDEVNTLIVSWIKFLKEVKSYSPNTLKGYVTDMYYFVQFLVDHFSETIIIEHLKELTVSDIRSWLSKRHKVEKKASSNARAISSLRSFYKYLFKYHNIDNQACFGVKIINKNQPLPKALSIDVVFKLIDGIEGFADEDWQNDRDKAIMLLLYGAGLRISEVLSIKFTDLRDLKHNRLRVIGKGKKDRVVPIVDRVVSAINSYLKSLPYTLDDDFIFKAANGGKLSPSNYRKRLMKLRRLLDLPEHASPHALRHSFATHLLAEDGDLLVIQELLGHESISTTQRYTKVDPSKLIEDYTRYFKRTSS